MLEKSLSIRNEIGDKRGISDCYENLGNLYAAKKDFHKACNFYMKNLTLRYEFGNKELLAKALALTGNTMLQLQEVRDAVNKYTESISISLESDNKIQAVNTIADVVGILYTIL